MRTPTAAFVHITTLSEPELYLLACYCLRPHVVSTYQVAKDSTALSRRLRAGLTVSADSITERLYNDITLNLPNSSPARNYNGLICTLTNYVAASLIDTTNHPEYIDLVAALAAEYQDLLTLLIAARHLHPDLEQAAAVARTWPDDPVSLVQLIATLSHSSAQCLTQAHASL